ncbi:MAG: MATE family efflux transporter [Candidatus Cloacimonetes bacterium]|nr:MATE family efflux transporter [Candidatus Cloacimonadota bacterium]
MKSRQTDLTQGNLFRNLAILALPIMASNLVQTLYNLTDAFWLGKLGSGARDAVSAVGISFPLIFFLQSFSFGFVVSGNSLVARYKGARQPEMIHRVIGQYFIILIGFVFIFLTGSLLLLDHILTWLQTPAEIFQSTRSYLAIIIPAQAFMMIVISIQSFYQGVGDTVTPMKIQMISVGVNLLIDPLLIFGIAFFPRLEIVGAAWATLFARILAAVLALISLFRSHRELLPRLKDLLPDREMLSQILRISIPASIGQSVSTFGFIVLQGFVNTYGTLVISTHVLNNRIQSLFMMPAMGISNALSAVVGQNLGAGEINRVQESVKVAFKFAIGIMAVGGITVFFFGGLIYSFFISDPLVVRLGGQVMRITCFTSLTFGILFVFLGVFNGAGYTKATMMINISRLWLVRLPLVFLLSGLLLNVSFFQNDILQPILKLFAFPLRERPYFALWYSMLISNIFSALWAIYIYRKGKWKYARVIS